MARKRSLFPLLQPRNFIKELQREEDQFERKVQFVGYIFEYLRRQKITAYLVGGEAIEIYTGGQFSTGDIDITTTNQEKTAKLLLELSFTKEGMIWLNEKLRIAVQIVASFPSRTEKIRTIKVKHYEIKVEGVEDLIVDRLVAAKFWRSNVKLDVEQATVLFFEFKDSMDMKYLGKRSSEENVADLLNDIKSNAKKG